MRTVTAAVLAALESGVVPRVFLAELELKSVTQRYWTGLGDISWNGQTWLGDVGMIVGIGDYEQSVEGGIGPASLTFSTSDPVRLTQILASDEIPGRPATVYEGLFDDSNGTIVPDAWAVHKRTMRRGPFNAQTRLFTLYLDHPFVGALRRVRRVRSFNDQKSWAAALGEANDEFFVDVTNVPSQRVSWPRSSFEVLRGT